MLYESRPAGSWPAPAGMHNAVPIEHHGVYLHSTQLHFLLSKMEMKMGIATLICCSHYMSKSNQTESNSDVVSYQLRFALHEPWP